MSRRILSAIYTLILALAAGYALYLYFTAPPAKNFLNPSTARILFFHAPEAMLCSLFFLWAAIMATAFLVTRSPKFDRSSLAAAEVGFILCLLATITGAIFAYEQWGIAWDWDPRQTSIFILLLIYAAYFALRGAFSSKEKSAAAAAAYAIFAFITVPFLVWVLPRLPQIATKHGGANQAVVGGGLDATYRGIFWYCALVIALISIWAYKLRVRQAAVSAALEDSYGADSDTAASARVVEPVRLRGDG